MLLTITTTHNPATDLGFLLHKHPAKLQEVEINHGKALIFYPKATDELCTCAMLMDIDPIGLIRDNSGTPAGSFALEQYVNDRPYVASSFMSTAIAKAFSSALNGNCKNRPELLSQVMPLTAKISVLPVKGGLELLEKLFVPLGYAIEATRHMLDPKFENWGYSQYYTVTLSNTLTVQQLLTHLFVLIPVADNNKHYWVSNEEVEKLLSKGSGWLETHPERELIVRRYLRYKRSMATEAWAILTKDEKESEEEPNEKTTAEEPKIRLHDVRLQAAHDALAAVGAESVADLGCGEGKLLMLLSRNRKFKRILGLDVSTRSLEIAAEKLKLKYASERDKDRITLVQGSLTYRDKRIEGFDAAALVEVIEHLDEDRLTSLEKTVFKYAAPATVIVTTPNKEWNVTFTTDEEKMRHSDHRFEWTRPEFAQWCSKLKEQYNYEFDIRPVGEETEGVGAPSQMAVFTKINPTNNNEN